jgi:trimethylamine:corrinoid methyltransferase-like protein
MVQRLVAGIEPRDDFPTLPRFQELLAEGHLLISEHTRQHLRREHFMPGRVIDRANRSRWQEEGGLSLSERARREIERLLGEHEPSRLPAEAKSDLEKCMTAAARRHGLSKLPRRDDRT